MASTYSAYLQSPSVSHLASDASLNYITTTTVINESTAILKHLQAQQKQVTKKEEKVLNAIEGPGSLFLETQVTLQFNNGGGAYLPQMDDNLLDEKLVIFPLLHVVSFDGEKKIKQIRLHWDQGTLLKQVEAIGRTGRNWPIRDGKAQADAISKSLKASGLDPDAKVPLGVRSPNEVVIREHTKRDSVSATRDPHASLALFSPRDPNQDAARLYEGPNQAVRASAKPAPRDYGELFAGEDTPKAPTGSNFRSPSPSKSDAVFHKGGAGKHFTGNRLFNENEESDAPRSPERKKVFSQKYDHFAFGDGEDVPQSGRPTSGGRGIKAQPTFSFEDFNTPPKYSAKVRPDDERHWGENVSALSTTSAGGFTESEQDDPPPSPPKRPIVHAARKDADPNFQFTDESSPATAKPKSLQRQKGMGLYQDLIGEEDSNAQSTRASQNASTNVNNNRRGNDFGAHYSMTDSPAPNDENSAPNKRANRSDMDQHWGHETPPKEKQMYKTAGDGMGGRAGARLWGIGDDSDPEVQANVRPSARSRRAVQAPTGAEAGF